MLLLACIVGGILIARKDKIYGTHGILSGGFHLYDVCGNLWFLHPPQFIGHAHQCRTDTEFGRHQLRRIQPIPLSRGTGRLFFALFAIGVSAAETAVAIAIIINIYRNVRNIQVKNLNEMKTNYGTYNTNPYPTFPQFPDTGAGRYAYEERAGRGHRHRFTGRGGVAFLPHCLQLFAGGRTAEGVYPTLTPYNFEWLPFTTNLHIDMGIMLDPISVMMLVVISTVSLMVHIYSFGYMKGEKAFNVTTHFLACLPCPCWDS